VTELPLATSAYDRAANRRGDEGWLQAAWQRARVVAVSPKSVAPSRRGSDGAPHLVYRSPGTVPDAAPRRFLGLVEDVPYFAVSVDPDDADEWLSLREIGPRADDLEASLLVAAIGLEQWHLRHTHCPRCGTPTVEAQAGWTRTCPNDGSEHFPRTDPAVIMLVHDGGDLALLGRGHQWGEGRFSTLAGFVEPGESLEAAVAREVYEEVGVAVRDVRYVASQPWPFPASLMVGFTARVDGDPTLHLDPVEMAEAAWFTREEVRRAAEWTDAGEPGDATARLRGVSPHLSISRYLLDVWLAPDHTP
jgi:NAD+ diphosphatase